jgi:hypothetical protein
MGSLTGQNLIDELKFLLQGRDDTGDVVTDARLLRWVNWSYNHVCYPNVHKHRELMTNYDASLATSDGSYAIDSSTVGYHINAVVSVTHFESATIADTTTRNRLRPRSYSWFENRNITTGKPSRYAIDGTTLYLDPVPTSTYNSQQLRVRLYREPADLSVSTSTVLSDVWDEVILQGAKWRAERDIGYREIAELTKQDFAALLNEFQEKWQLETFEEIEWMPGVEHGNPVM